MIWHLLTLKRVTIIVLVINLVLVAFTAFIFLSKGPTPPPKTSANKKQQSFDDNFDPWGFVTDSSEKGHQQDKLVDEMTNLHEIEVWSKAAIGNYLWQHILKSKLRKTGYYFYGTEIFDNLKFVFRSSPTLTVHSLRHHLSSMAVSRNVLLVLNGRDDEKIDNCKSWLDELSILKSSGIKLNAGALLLGHEECLNQWIKMYLASNNGPLSFIFVVYDWKSVDGSEIFQWPLGVATYRNFPSPDTSNKAIEDSKKFERKYVCNFLGTVYENSTRIELVQSMKELNTKFEDICYLRQRMEWEPNETKESIQLYINLLSSSDLTLSPIGMNHECYRIYEAMALGSVPVIEENLSHVIGSNCDHSRTYRLLREYDAPVIYVRNWTTELPLIIENEMKLSLQSKIERRENIIIWYEDFKSKMKKKLFSVIKDKFGLH